jgi:hypothetical protein
MDENPYKAPVEGSAKEPKGVLRWPETIIEWTVIVIVAILVIAYLLPDPLEPRGAARKRMAREAHQQQVK